MSKSVDFHKLGLKRTAELSTVSTRHLLELEQEIRKQQAEGNFNEQLSQEYLSRFKFAPPQELPNSRSHHRCCYAKTAYSGNFTIGRERSNRSFCLQRTLRMTRKDSTLNVLWLRAVGKEGYRIATPILPLKLLAVHGGIAEYGRNNITYVSGMGSFMRLTAVYSDMPCETDHWREVADDEKLRKLQNHARKLVQQVQSPRKSFLA